MLAATVNWIGFFEVDPPLILGLLETKTSSEDVGKDTWQAIRTLPGAIFFCALNPLPFKYNYGFKRRNLASKFLLNSAWELVERKKIIKIHFAIRLVTIEGL